MAFKLVISDPKTGFSVQKDSGEDAAKRFLGLKIGDKVKGELIDLQGYEFELTGGSDFCGFPMRKDVPGTGRKKILSYSGVGFRKLGKGVLQRKTVCGNTIHAKTAQINLKIIAAGSTEIFSEVKKKVDEKQAAKKPAAKKDEAPAAEAKPTEKAQVKVAPVAE